jgi:hypothetical protein
MLEEGMMAVLLPERLKKYFKTLLTDRLNGDTVQSTVGTKYATKGDRIRYEFLSIHKFNI